MEGDKQQLLTDVSASIARDRREIDRLRQQAKRKRFDGFTYIQRRTALIIYTMGGYDGRPVAYYLLQLMGMEPQRASGTDTDTVLRIVEDWFLACTEDETLSLNQVSLRGDESLFRRAAHILAGHHLKDWVFSMNLTKGLAPACRDLALKWDELHVEGDVDAEPDALLSRENLSLSKNRKFFSRWRCSFGVRLGKIQTREAFTRDEIAAKAGVNIWPWRHFHVELQ
jgi:hypothetical protein